MTNENMLKDDFAHLGGFDDDSKENLKATKVFTKTSDTDTSSTNDDPNLIPNPFEPKEESEFVEVPVQPNKQDLLIEKILSRKGIQGVDKVLYEDGDQVIEKNFFDLPEADQLEILTDDADLTEEEVYYLGQARQNGISFTDLIQYYVNLQLDQSKSENKTSVVDDYTDEELYVLDLKARLGETMTDDEILSTLEKELESPEIFKKKIDALRGEYKALEEQEATLKDQHLNETKEAEHAEYTKTINELINSVEDIGGVLLEDSDRSELFSFLADRDVNGQTAYEKQMRDPENKFLAAWAILKANDTIEIIKEHYENQIKSLKKTATPTKPGATVVVQAKTPKIRSVEDLNTFND